MIRYALLFVCLGGVLGGALGRESPNARAASKLFETTRYSNNIEEDARLDGPALVRKYGYPIEIHKVVTPDGHILEVHRIPRGRDKNNGPETDKPVVFLMHGLLMSSADWVLLGPGKGFAYLLAEAGYDVWLGNARGNYYSRSHSSLNPSSSKFWEFSWHEIGYLDLATMIDYAIEKSGQRKIHYVGHSQGTTSLFVLLTMKAEYNSKFKSVHAFAPVAFMENLKSPFVRILAPFANTLNVLASLIGLNEFMPNTDFITEAGGALCRESGVFAPVCANVLFIICGFNVDQLNATMLPVFLGHTPAGASSKQFVHYGQGVNDGHFRLFDYGFIGNLVKYGSRSPPDYRLDRITAPVALHYADNDWLADVGDVDRLFRGLAKPIGKFRVPMNEFNHLDFLWATDADTLLYNRVINLIGAFD